MAFEGLTPVTDVSVGDWLEPRMCGFGSRVCSVVPTAGFAAVARVLHPPEDRDGAVTWAEVCRRLGRTPHARMTWREVAGVREVRHTERRRLRRRTWTTTTSEWPGPEPEEGNLAPAVLSPLLDVLDGHTADAARCFHALWEGWGWLDGRGVALLTSGWGPEPPPPPPGIPPEALAAPRLRLPHRDHVLFRGPLRAALTMGWDHGRFQPQSPSLLWPADRSWCLATEIDFDSTLVAGSQALVDDVLAAPGIEAWRVDPDDDLSGYGGRLDG